MKTPEEISYLSIGGIEGIGASCHYLKFGEWGIILDAGLDPQSPDKAGLPDFDRLKGLPVNAIIISHAHLDHLGALPIAIRYFPHARVYMTPATVALSEIMLFHYIKVREKRALEMTQRLAPLYTGEEVESQLFLYQSFDYNFPFTIHGFQDSQIQITFWDAGHILGSAGIEIEWRGRKIFYTGNTKKSAQFILKGARYPAKTDILITETTYGANSTALGISKKAEVNRFINFIEEKLKLNGAILVPVFALGRTQEIMYLLYQLISRGKLPAVPIYLTGMGLKINKVYDRLLHKIYPRYHPKILKTITSDVLFSKNYRSPCIILSTSGMMIPNTISFEIAGTFLEDPRNGIALVGWADPETPGGKIRDRNIENIREAFQVEKVVCDLEVFHFSAHSHREELIQMTKRLNPDITLLCHGDADSLQWMKKNMEDLKSPPRVIIPQPLGLLKL
jgi:Cft2 family RNA processing exonuclease